MEILDDEHPRTHIPEEPEDSPQVPDYGGSGELRFCRPAFIQRVHAAMDILREGAHRSDVRDTHGRFVLEQADRELAREAKAKLLREVPRRVL